MDARKIPGRIHLPLYLSVWPSKEEEPFPYLTLFSLSPPVDEEGGPFLTRQIVSVADAVAVPIAALAVVHAFVAKKVWLCGHLHSLGDGPTIVNCT